MPENDLRLIALRNQFRTLGDDPDKTKEAIVGYINLHRQAGRRDADILADLDLLQLLYGSDERMLQAFSTACEVTGLKRPGERWTSELKKLPQPLGSVSAADTRSTSEKTHLQAVAHRAASISSEASSVSDSAGTILLDAGSLRRTLPYAENRRMSLSSEVSSESSATVILDGGSIRSSPAMTLASAASPPPPIRYHPAVAALREREGSTSTRADTLTSLGTVYLSPRSISAADSTPPRGDPYILGSLPSVAGTSKPHLDADGLLLEGVEVRANGESFDQPFEAHAADESPDELSEHVGTPSPFRPYAGLRQPPPPPIPPVHDARPASPDRLASLGRKMSNLFAPQVSLPALPQTSLGSKSTAARISTAWKARQPSSASETVAQVSQDGFLHPSSLRNLFAKEPPGPGIPTVTPAQASLPLYPLQVAQGMTTAPGPPTVPFPNNLQVPVQFARQSQPSLNTIFEDGGSLSHPR